jgi:nucleoside-diphosphate-sugar epimerase
VKIVVIGGTGHIGTYLVPRLVEAGHQVVCIARGTREPYRQHPAWREVERVAIDRAAEESNGTFGPRVASMNADVVVDLICFTLESARHLANALIGRVDHFLHCGTLWVHGPSARVPTTEDEVRRPFGDYGIRKAAVEAYLIQQSRDASLPVTILHPGHIVGPGWNPLNPAGHFTPTVFTTLARGEPLTLPNLGLETVHHVHADDVAQSFACAIQHRDRSIGESFNVVSPQAMTLRGYAEGVAAWFGCGADLRYMPWTEWKGAVTAQEAAYTWDHIAHSPCASIEKARTRIGYAPRYSSLDAVREAVDWLVAAGRIQL